MAHARFSIPSLYRLQVLLVVSILAGTMLGSTPGHAGDVSPVSVSGVTTVNTEEARALHDGGRFFSISGQPFYGMPDGYRVRTSCRNQK